MIDIYIYIYIYNNKLMRLEWLANRGGGPSAAPSWGRGDIHNVI